MKCFLIVVKFDREALLPSTSSLYLRTMKKSQHSALTLRICSVSGIGLADVIHCGPLLVCRFHWPSVLKTLKNYWKVPISWINTSWIRHSNKMRPSFWHCLAFGTRISMVPKHMLFSHTINICIALPLTSNKVIWKVTEKELPKLANVLTTTLARSCGENQERMVNMLSTNWSIK